MDVGLVSHARLTRVSRLVAALGLLTGLFLVTSSSARSAGAVDGLPLGAKTTFEATNVPGFFIRHRFTLAEITRIGSNLDRADGTWIVRPALSGAAGAVSFESTNYPGTYLRHQNFRLKQHRYDGQDLVRRDASFVVRPALNGLPGAFSFESVNVPGFYIRHSNYQLWINRNDGSDLFRQDASFRPRASFQTDPDASFESVNYPGYFVRHRFALGEISRLDPASMLDRRDASWIVRPALSGTRGAVSFESVNYPGTYLRHQDFRVKQQRYDGSELFRNDASFYQRSGLGTAGYSYESVNFPQHFIRHSNYQLWIARNDNSQLFRQDASFNQRLAQYVEPGDCTTFLRRWRGGYEGDDTMGRCVWIMGIEQYCRARDAFPGVAYDGNRRYLKCAPYSHPDSAVEQIEHIARGVAQGLTDAYVAAAPFVTPVVAGLGCINGVVYACGTLALEFADQAGLRLPPEATEAATIVKQVNACVEGAVVDCGQLGARGARALSLKIPGEDVAQVVEDGRKCGNGEFAACVRLGLKAADAAGVPVGLGTADVTNAQDCLANDSNACADLGRRAAQAVGIPLGGVTQGVTNAHKCGNGDRNACIALGHALGVPVGLGAADTKNAQDCAAGNSNACAELGRLAAQAVGIPLGGVTQGVTNARNCRNGDRNACMALGRAVMAAARYVHA
jgi:Alpha-L-arabinofuranosidase B (ABFB) domain